MNTSIYSQLILLNNNIHYLRRYVKLVSFFKERNFKKKKFLHHEHHIIPESFGGLNTVDNLVFITIREHFILHWMLYKAFPKSTMTTAFFLMCNGCKKYNTNKITSKVYQNAMLEFAERNAETSRERANKRVADGKHQWQGDGEFQRQIQKKRIAEGRHNLQGENNPSHKRVADGTHHWLGPESNLKRVADGNHPFSGGEIVRKMIANGTHPSQIKKLCPHCKQEFNLMNYGKWHGDKCKLNPLYKKEIKKIKEKFECPHCHRYFSKNTFTRYHGDKCKLKP